MILDFERKWPGVWGLSVLGGVSDVIGRRNRLRLQGREFLGVISTPAANVTGCRSHRELAGISGYFISGTCLSSFRAWQVCDPPVWQVAVFVSARVPGARFQV